MVPSGPQDPPMKLGDSATVTGVPPVAGTLLILPSLWNPIDWPSGEKNGTSAPSEPATGSTPIDRGVMALLGRSQSLPGLRRCTCTGSVLDAPFKRRRNYL